MTAQLTIMLVLNLILIAGFLWERHLARRAEQRRHEELMLLQAVEARAVKAARELTGALQAAKDALEAWEGEAQGFEGPVTKRPAQIVQLFPRKDGA